MKTATLPVPGADLYYELRGDGPLLLISQSGEGDARRSSDLVDNLVDRFTVLTYDRRGLSRSTRTDPALPVSPETNADDLHHLLAAVTDEPALMLGCSLGALYGLHLAAAHPGQISTLVAHDPATPGLLPSAERDRVARTLEEISAVHRRDGWQAAMRRIAAFTGIDMATMKTEPEVTLPPITPERVTNIEFFLSNDLDGLAHSTLDAGDVARTMRHPRHPLHAAATRRTPGTTAVQKSSRGSSTSPSPTSREATTATRPSPGPSPPA